LVPTLFLQDILILAVLISWFFESASKHISLRSFYNDRVNQLLIFFLFSLFLSSLGASRLIPSVSFVAHIVLYSFLFFYIRYNFDIHEEFSRVCFLLILPFIFVSVLGIAQFFNQGSIFNNYLVLGEQPYSVSKWGINREVFLGDLVVPSYGLFRHPNVFGAYLVIILMFFTLAGLYYDRKYLYLLPLGITALFCTLSYSAWIVFVLGMFLAFIVPKTPKPGFIAIVSVLICLALLMLPALDFSNPSLFRRSHLLTASYRLISDYPLFGIGSNNFTAVFEKYLPPVRDIRFVQPVHNIYVLIWSESGIFALLFFLLFLIFSVRRLVLPSYTRIFSKVFLVILMQILLLGSFDHYFWTIHQTQILFWLVLGMIHKI
jgi:O-antigen ligase